MTDTITVDVRVYENDLWVATTNVTYYPGQPYEVVIQTPDGIDATTNELTAGKGTA